MTLFLQCYQRVFVSYYTDDADFVHFANVSKFKENATLPLDTQLTRFNGSYRHVAHAPNKMLDLFKNAKTQYLFLSGIKNSK